MSVICNISRIQDGKGLSTVGDRMVGERRVRVD